MRELIELIEKTEKTEERYLVLERMIAAPEIIADNRYWRKLLLEKEGYEDVVRLRRELVRIKKEYDACKINFEKEKDDELKKAFLEELVALSAEGERLCARLEEILAEKSGQDCVVLELRPGGNKALSFCEMLQTIFRNFAARIGLEVQSRSDTLLFTGTGAGARLREENGVHKLIGEETVTVTVTMMPYRPQTESEIDEKDLKIDLFHSGGAGGQNINKVETAIRITHLPTGIVVTCQDERSQLQNKRKALERLKNRLAQRHARLWEEERERLRKSAGKEVVCTYNVETDIVTKKNGDKYYLHEYQEGIRKKI